MGLPIEIELPEHFLEKEVRCGYEVSEKLKKIWAVELDLLKYLLDVCKKHNINVQVFAGTLLGAVRHKGFIPWDDDVDVAMTREDFNKLCEIASVEFKEPYFFQTALTDEKYYFSYGRLRNSHTTGIIADNESADYNNGIFIDVFPLDGFPNSKIRDKIQLCLMRIFVKICTTYRRDRRKNNSAIEIISRIARPFLRLFPFRIWNAIYNNILSMWTDDADKIGLRSHFSFGDRYCVLKTEFAETVELPFESLMVPAPRCYDKVLTRIYGDYMTFPSVSQRGKWHEGQIHFEPEIPYRDYLIVGNAF